MDPIPTPRTDRLRSALEELKGIGPKLSQELTSKLSDIEALRTKLEAEYDEEMRNLAEFLWADGQCYTDAEIEATALANEPRLMHEYRKQKHEPSFNKILHWQANNYLNIAQGGLWFSISTTVLGHEFEPASKAKADEAAKRFIRDHQVRTERVDIRCRMLQAYLDGNTEQSPQAAYP